MPLLTVHSVLFFLVAACALRDIAKKRMSTWTSLLIRTLVALVIIETWVFEVRRVNSWSMAPNIHPGDTFLIPKQTFGFSFPFLYYKLPFLQSHPETGDLVVHRYPADPSHVFVKRVVAVPGDIVEYRENRLLVNRKEVTPDAGLCRTERMGPATYQVLYDPAARTRDVPKLQVPDGHVYVLGDNRDHSEDSRYWGPLDERLLVGEPAYRLYRRWPFIDRYHDVKECAVDPKHPEQSLGPGLPSVQAKH